MPDMVSSSSHPLDPEKNYLLQTLDIGFPVEFKAKWEDGLSNKVAIASDHPKHHNVDWVFGFHQNDQKYLREEPCAILNQLNSDTKQVARKIKKAKFQRI